MIASNGCGGHATGLVPSNGQEMTKATPTDGRERRGVIA
jgi:hypothetical protein